MADLENRGKPRVELNLDFGFKSVGSPKRRETFCIHFQIGQERE